MYPDGIRIEGDGKPHQLFHSWMTTRHDVAAVLNRYEYRGEPRAGQETDRPAAGPVAPGPAPRPGLMLPGRLGQRAPP